MPGDSGGRAPRCVICQLTTSSRDDLLNTVRAGTDGVALIEQLVERPQFESTSLTDRLEHQGLPLDWLQPVRRIPASACRKNLLLIACLCQGDWFSDRSPI